MANFTEFLTPLSSGTLYDAKVLQKSSQKNGIGDGVVAPTVKLPIVMLASHIGVPLIECQLLHSGSSREGSRTPLPSLWETWMQFLAPGFGLEHLPLQLLGVTQRMEKLSSSLSSAF